jgi:hypothetical protein
MRQKAKEAIALARTRGFKPKFFKSTRGDRWTDWATWNRQPVCAVRFSDGSAWDETEGWASSQANDLIESCSPAPPQEVRQNEIFLESATNER